MSWAAAGLAALATLATLRWLYNIEHAQDHTE